MRRGDERIEGRDHLIDGIVLGAGLMYLFDPDRGRRRRALVRDQGIHLMHVLDEASGTTARDVRNRARGILSETRSRFRRDHASDRVVEARVRSELGRLVSHPGSIRVEAAGGTILLSGPVLAHELTTLVSGVGRVRGVREVVNELRVHESPGDEPGLQGESRRPQNRPELLQEHWSPATRLIGGILGGALTARGLRGEGVLHAITAAVGIGILTRSLTNMEVKRITGVNAGRRAVDVHKIITVDAPIGEVFDFWSNFENLPLFMEHLVEVRVTGDGTSHWTAEGPAGIPISWDAEITTLQDRDLIAWKSTGTSPVGNAGIVRFQEVGPGSTRIDVRMSYNPPAGAIGHLVASFFGVDPKHAMEDDLVRLKSLLEEGRTRADGHRVTRSQIESRIGNAFVGDGARGANLFDGR
jgi:uncharacterized membrane protein